MKQIVISFIINVCLFTTGFLVAMYGNTPTLDTNIVQTMFLFLFVGIGMGAVSTILLIMQTEKFASEKE
jgi:formate-dependent nitrite reductase membrane component NrfD